MKPKQPQRKKKTKEPIMSKKNVNKVMEESARYFKNSDEAEKVVKEMEKGNKCSILWLAYQQGKIFENI